MSIGPITNAKIHPAIGVARVGGSLTEYFIGPETPVPGPVPEGGYRDATGKLKRQAARFRIYGYDDQGNVVGEIDASMAQITWTVHVANKKGSWYDFDLALDIPEAATTQSARRNTFVPKESRGQLSIDPGSRSITGVKQGPISFDSGTFFGKPVYLGELRTDEAGRLLFLGGYGDAGSPISGFTLTTFDNNAGWYDDTSDGPVHATVVMKNGPSIPVDSAWVVTGPPDYAPNVMPVQSMYDVVFNTLKGLFVTQPSTPSFCNDVLPIFRQLATTAWVNRGFHMLFGWKAPYDFLEPELLAKLSSTDAEFTPLRQQIFSFFRIPSSPFFQPFAWPPIYGDAFITVTNGTPSARNALALNPTTYNYLAQWAAGDFVADYDPAKPPSSAFDDYAVADQPALLDRAALSYLLGGPFHPGCELTWPMRVSRLYRGAFRIREAPPGIADADYGEVLTQAIINLDSGPLSSTPPGGLTRWMSVPWQADTTGCRQGYQFTTSAGLFPPNPYIPGFWPARAPDEVLSEGDYNIVMDTTLPLKDRKAAFQRRVDWLRAINTASSSFIAAAELMVKQFNEVGVVEPRSGPANDPNFPEELQVEITYNPAPPSTTGKMLDLTVAQAKFGKRAIT